LGQRVKIDKGASPQYMAKQWGYYVSGPPLVPN
jgi:hypothetical protein